MNEINQNLLQALADIASAEQERLAEWNDVTTGRKSVEEVAQLMRARGVSEEEIARASELFAPFSREEKSSLLAQVLASTRSSGASKRKFAASPRWYSLPTEATMSWIALLLILLVVVAVIPTWPHSQNWGYNPAGVLGFILVVLVVLKLLHKL
jgi:hypothetical protein